MFLGYTKQIFLTLKHLIKGKLSGLILGAKEAGKILKNISSSNSR